MNGAFYIGAAGLEAQQNALEVVANNIANINTVGFKRSAVRFSELVGPVRDADGLPVVQTPGNGSLSGAVLGATPRVWAEGPLNQTGRSLDLAINGNGFVEVLGPAGRLLLWRGGTLKVNDDGMLATADGTVLRSQISLPQGASNIRIDSNGVVSAVLGGDTQPREIGRIDLVTAKDLDSLTDVGDGKFEAADSSALTAAEPGQDGAGTFVQGSIEGGNVQFTDEMVTLLLLQRAFAANAQVVQAGDQLMSIANGLRR